LRTLGSNSATPITIIALTVIAFLSIALSQPLFADESMLAKEQKLNQLKVKIRELRNTLTSSTNKKNRLQYQLQKSETEIGRISRSLTQFSTKLKQHKQKLKTLQQEKKDKSDKLQQHQQLLAQQIRASYAMGTQGYARILLNQKDPSAIGRTLVYYDYLNQSRTDNIKAIDKRIERLSLLEREIQQKQQQIKQAQQREKTAKKTLEEKRHSRQQILKNIKKDIKNQAQRLTLLIEARKDLEQLLSSLSEALADIPADAGDIRPFHQLKGRLHPPARGQIKNHFGKRREGGSLKWQGLTISAQTGTQVHAVHHGRIAFSNWLRGFGQLLIIDHGDGYMSLYGHNESLIKDVGEWVETGEEIATVGESGGQSMSGLYFEIRKNGKPLNPRRWLARK